MMERSDFIEKVTNTGLFTSNEAIMLADSTDDYVETSLRMYWEAEDLESFNALVGSKINRNFTEEQLGNLRDKMDEEW